MILLDLSKVAVVILNYNTRSLLERFLPLLINYSGDAKIVVADNASNDDSVQFVKQHYTCVTCIELSENFGFCKGYNEALKHIDAEYTILLNSDVEVTEGWLVPLVNFLDNNKDVVCCQPKIKSYHNKTNFEYAGAAGGYIDYLGYPFCRGRIFETVEEDKGQYDSTSQVFWASGACMCVRTELYKKFGGLDESFFAHMEEIDLCWRWQLAGYKIYFVPNSTVYHIGGGTLAYDNPRKVYYNFRNGLFLLFKNLPANKLLYILWVRMLLDGIAGIKFLFSGNVNGLFAIIRAHLHFYFSIPLLIKKRKSTYGVRRSLDVIYNKSIVFEYFLKKNVKFSDTTMNLTKD